MSKLKLLIVFLGLFLLTGCSASWEDIMSNYNIPEDGLTCSYKTYSFPIGGVETESSDFSIQIIPSTEKDNNGKRKMKIYASIDGGPPTEITQDQKYLKMKGYGINIDFMWSESALKAVLEHYKDYGVCLDTFNSCPKNSGGWVAMFTKFGFIATLKKANYDEWRALAAELEQAGLLFKSEIVGNEVDCGAPILIRHDATKKDELGVDYDELTKKSYCVITMKTGSLFSFLAGENYYSRVSLYRKDNEKYYFRFDLASNNSCALAQGYGIEGQVYPVKKGYSITTPNFYFPDLMQGGITFRKPYYNVTVPAEETYKLFPEDGTFPKVIWACGIEGSWGGYAMTLHADLPAGAKKEECQKSSEFRYAIEEGYTSGSGEDYTTPASCEGIFGSLTEEIQGLFNIIKIIAPILVFVLSSFDFLKAVLAQDKEANKKAFNKFIKRLLLAVLVFLLPIIINLVLDAAGSTLNDPVCNIR